MSRFAIAITVAGGLLLGCNPLVYDKILEDAPVFEFKITGPSGSIHRHVIVVDNATGMEPNHALVGSMRGVGLAWISLNAGGTPVTDVIDNKRADNAAFPIESAVDTLIGGLALVPASDGGTEPDALVALLSPNEPFLSRVVRVGPSDFIRVENHDDDIVAPKVDDVSIPGFGKSLAAINLDGPQSDPLYEVAVGSEQGLLIFDSVGQNADTYRQAAESLEFDMPGSCLGANEPNCFGFTRCEDLADANAIASAQVGAGGSAAILAGTADGVVFVADFAAPMQNAIGAPQFDCASDLRAAPMTASAQFGSAFLAKDLDGDGATDLAVGDPGANAVFVYRSVGGDLEAMPSATLTPDDETVASFGTALGTADLGGTLGPVFVVGAPGTAVDSKADVGTVIVYEQDVFSAPFDAIADLRDQNPEAGSEHGQWVGGLSLGDRDELVVMGRNEGRVHRKINGLDPAPGDAAN